MENHGEYTPERPMIPPQKRLFRQRYGPSRQRQNAVPPSWREAAARVIALPHAQKPNAVGCRSTPDGTCAAGQRIAPRYGGVNCLREGLCKRRQAKYSANSQEKNYFRCRTQENRSSAEGPLGKDPGGQETLTPAFMMTRRPCIGVFDSGFGGLTVLKALLKLIPHADYLYFGDTARLPYGSKSVETVAKYAVEAARFLEQKQAQMLVIACNTATALALDQITAAAKVPVVGVVEPGAERSAASSAKKKVVVIGTEATVSSHAYKKALLARGVQAHEKACPLFVPLVEEGWNDHRVTEEVAGIYLKQAFAEGFEDADVLLLGCTHYPLIKPVLHRVAPPHVRIVDSAEATADEVAALLRRLPTAGPSGDEERKLPPRVTFFATDSVEKFRRLGPKFLGLPVEDVQHVDLKE